MENLWLVGAMIGDIAGSYYESNNIKYLPRDLITQESRFTDDTVLTFAIAQGIISGLDKTGRDYSVNNQGIIKQEVTKAVLHFARKYPRAGYGGSFIRWAQSNNPRPYGSWANGSAMRASFPGWIADSLDEAKLLARLSAEITHNHEEGIKGAEVIAACIYLLRNGASKEEVRDYVSNIYDISFSLDQIRDDYKFDVSCAGSVPQAIVAFLESNSFEQTIKLAISIGGDSDTIAAIAGSLAEAYYVVPGELITRALVKLDRDLTNTLKDISEYLRQNSSPSRAICKTIDISQLNDCISKLMMTDGVEWTATDVQQVTDSNGKASKQYTFGYPIYPEELTRLLFELTNIDFSADFPTVSSKRVAELSLQEIIAYLCLIYRNERFCDGHIASYIRNGKLLHLVMMLKVLLYDADHGLHFMS